MSKKKAEPNSIELQEMLRESHSEYDALEYRWQKLSGQHDRLLKEHAIAREKLAKLFHSYKTAMAMIHVLTGEEFLFDGEDKETGQWRIG